LVPARLDLSQEQLRERIIARAKKYGQDGYR
jgi:hypothetical protein